MARCRTGCGIVAGFTMATTTTFSPEFASPQWSTAQIDALRSRARARFDASGFPSRRQEDWRFTDLKGVTDGGFRLSPSTAFDIRPWTVDNSHRIVFRNGVPDHSESTLGALPSGLVVSTLAEAMRTDQALVDQHLGQQAAIEDHAFVALNTAQNLAGAFVSIAGGIEVERPIHIIHCTSGPNPVTYPRSLVVAGPGSKVTVIETFLADSKGLTVPVTEIVLANGADVRHTRLQDQDPLSHHLGALAVSVDGRARYSMTSAALGASTSRLDIGVTLIGEEAIANLDGLSLVDQQRHGEHHVIMRHHAGACTSNQRFRSVLDDRSRAVFTGKIEVAEGAQLTDANQSSRALLRSDQAVAFSNPQLEIYADDVRCTHGSTIGELDEEAIFYLRARGLSAEAARTMLTVAFAAEVLNEIPEPTIRERLEDKMGRALTNGVD